VGALVKRVLMLAFHFPPMRGSSGSQRTLNFCRYLPEHGWETRVLTVAPRAHPETSDDQLADIPAGTVVRRSWAIDTARHAAILGRYPGWLARPDRWASWWLSAVPSALREISSWRPDVVWSTFPIATAHSIAASLQSRRDLPWVADFRDVMTEDDFPSDPRVRAHWRRIEARVMAQAARIVFTTRGAISMYSGRYPAVPAERWAHIANGYAEEDFLAAERDRVPRQDARLQLLHSGLMYPSERDPTQLFAALAALKREGVVSAGNITVTLRATGQDAHVAELARRAGIEDLVDIAPPLPYRAALAEMLSADALLVLQAANCNQQIPAKIYEYMRSGRPIIALTDPAGETGKTLIDGGLHTIAPLDQTDRIRELLARVLPQIRAGTAQVPKREYATSFSRRSQTAQLAAVLDSALTTRKKMRTGSQ
jgi:glycosyltransferase involved in cell wall biosynthesis